MGNHMNREEVETLIGEFGFEVTPVGNKPPFAFEYWVLDVDGINMSVRAAGMSCGHNEYTHLGITIDGEVGPQYGFSITLCFAFYARKAFIDLVQETMLSVVAQHQANVRRKESIPSE